MRNIDEWIADWRAGLADSEAIGPTDLEEMESHLREEITHLQATGLSGEEAFLVARRRLGDPAALEDEFAKVNLRRGLVHRLAWAVMGVLLYIAATTFGNAASSFSMLVGTTSDLSQTDLVIFVGVTKTAALAAAFALALWLCIRLSRSPSPKLCHRGKIRPILVAITLAVGTLVFEGTGLLFNHLTWRFASAESYAQLLYARDYAILASWIATPILLAGFFCVLHWRARQPSQAQ